MQVCKWNFNFRRFSIDKKIQRSWNKSCDSKMGFKNKYKQTFEYLLLKTGYILGLEVL